MNKLKKLPMEIFKTFEEIWENMSEKQKNINLEYWYSLYAKDKTIIIKPLKEKIKHLEKENEYLKKNYKELQSKLEEPLDELFIDVRLVAKEMNSHTVHIANNKGDLE